MESKYGKYIVTDLKAPDFGPEFTSAYNKFASRILWIDENVVEGSFQLNCSWYLKPNEDHLGGSHVHDHDEIIGFFGSDPQNSHNLGGEIEFWMEDEQHIITKSCLIFVPAGIKHCPLILKRVDSPIFHFTTVKNGRYEISKVKSGDK